MKKVFAIVLTASLALALVVMLAGCGGGDDEADKARPKELMQTGDAWIEEAEADFEAVSSARQEMMESISSGEAEMDDGDVEGFIEDIESASQSMAESLEEAEAAYQAIVSMDDAVDYKEYAGVMLELIAEYEQVLSRQEEMSQRMAEGGVRPMGDGPPADFTPPEGTGRGAFRGGMTGNIEELKAEAEAMKKEKNL